MYMLNTTFAPFPPIKIKNHSFYRDYGEDEGSLRKVTEALGLKVGDLVIRHNFVSSMTQAEIEETTKKIHSIILQCAYESYSSIGDEEFFVDVNDRRYSDYSDSFRRINSYSRTVFHYLPEYLRTKIEGLFLYQDGTNNLNHWMGMDFSTLSHYVALNRKRVEEVIKTGNIVSDFSDYDKNVIDYFKFACRDLDIASGVKLITDITLGRNVNIITYYNFGVNPQEHKCLVLKEGTRASSASSFLCFSKVPESPSKNHEEEENPAEEE